MNEFTRFLQSFLRKSASDCTMRDSRITSTSSGGLTAVWKRSPTRSDSASGSAARTSSSKSSGTDSGTPSLGAHSGLGGTTSCVRRSATLTPSWVRYLTQCDVCAVTSAFPQGTPSGGISPTSTRSTSTRNCSSRSQSPNNSIRLGDG